MQLELPNCFPLDSSSQVCNSNLCSLSYQSKGSSIWEDIEKVHLVNQHLVKLSNNQPVLVLD